MFSPRGLDFVFSSSVSETTKGRLIGYWILTGIIVVTQGASGVLDLIGADAVVDGVTALGYPAYLVKILGPAKLSGVIVLAIPGALRLKEWAYAGFVIDFLGATASHFFHGDGPELIAAPFVFLLILLGSYRLRPASRTLAP